MRRIKRLTITSAVGFAPFGLLFAQEESGSSSSFVELAPHVVTASPFVTNVDELVVPVSELAGEELDRKAVSNLGATLDGEPGVHSTYFGPGAGRPVIRGFDGDRVRILNQGTDSHDVSQTSPDHAVGIEPLFAHDIEVVRGPASLLYGNAAIGGVVNVIGKELPIERAQVPISGEIEVSYGSVADEKSAGVALEGGQGDIAWSLGYFERSSGDIEIPGYAESAYQMEAEEEEENHEEEEEVFGVLENSFVDTRSGYVGMTWFGDSGSFGFSFSKYDTDYGVPGHSHEHEHEEEEDHDEEEEEHAEESVSIDLDQSRFALRGELIDPVDFFESVELNFSYGEYQHKELEGDEVGTVFDRDGFELRLTGVHRPLGDLTGAIGFQLKGESFSAVGEEAFIPANDSTQYGLFAVERLNREWGAWEFGGRIENVDVDPVDSALSGKSFTTGNASAGFVRKVGESAVFATNLTYTERAPSASELYAFGPHVGTQSYEIGDSSLGLESSVNLDMSYRLVAGKVTGEFTVFYSDFSDYIYMRYLDEDTIASLYGELDTDGLDLFQATPADAKFYGYELDLRYHIVDEIDRAMHIDVMLDQTRATNERFDTNMPRIPTRRIGARYEYASGPWVAGIEGRYHEAASHLAPNELPTDSYFLWGADLLYRIQTTDSVTVDLFAIGSNLGDEEARAHTSYLKDLAPMPGRSVKLGVRTRF
ncbi:TonB-dependent receptor [Pelagicoccus albus]|uniref:TonB-dependent receptor n=1 Tax=Pelagicoccus albus TaxID=415222 RepID=A0A7X1B9K0_9BACT|nr:TonB-dependent receptor [Pelagicoccus albus]MBC2607839.1 TonB-dependent receptor [Pelagicoccus albus]